MTIHWKCRGGAPSPPEISIRDRSAHESEFVDIHSIEPIGSSFYCGRTRWSAPTILIALFLMVPPAQAATYAVKAAGGGDYTTIQACANAMSRGDTCVVYAGTYNEHVALPAGNAGAYKTLQVNGTDLV